MVDILKFILDLQKLRNDLAEKLEKIKDLSKDKILYSSDPNETSNEDVIQSIESVISLISIEIEQLRKLDI